MFEKEVICFREIEDALVTRVEVWSRPINMEDSIGVFLDSFGLNHHGVFIDLANGQRFLLDIVGLRTRQDLSPAFISLDNFVWNCFSKTKLCAFVYILELVCIFCRSHFLGRQLYCCIWSLVCSFQNHQGSSNPKK